MKSESNTRRARLFATLSITASAGLLCLYLGPGDRRAWSEFLTLWPPQLWLMPLSVVAACAFHPRRRKPFLLSAAAVLIFFIAAVEWRSLLRFGPGVTGDPSPGIIRVVTWNVDSASAGKGRILSELERLRPDLCLFQETPDGDLEFGDTDFTGAWEGFHAADIGDCGLISRYEISESFQEKVGPWAPVQGVVIEPHEGSRIAVLNVRLMLPSLVLNPLPQGDRARLSGMHEQRMSQNRKLAELVGRVASREDITGVIVAGDFNTIGGAKSLRVLRNHVSDVWPVSGRGRGSTAITAFRVARIDQIHADSRLTPFRAFVIRSDASDHLPLYAELQTELPH